MLKHIELAVIVRVVHQSIRPVDQRLIGHAALLGGRGHVPGAVSAEALRHHPQRLALQDGVPSQVHTLADGREVVIALVYRVGIQREHLGDGGVGAVLIGDAQRGVGDPVGVDAFDDVNATADLAGRDAAAVGFVAWVPGQDRRVVLEALHRRHGAQTFHDDLDAQAFGLVEDLLEVVEVLASEVRRIEARRRQVADTLEDLLLLERPRHHVHTEREEGLIIHVAHVVRLDAHPRLGVQDDGRGGVALRPARTLETSGQLVLARRQVVQRHACLEGSFGRIDDNLFSLRLVAQQLQGEAGGLQASGRVRQQAHLGADGPVVGVVVPCPQVQRDGFRHQERALGAEERALGGAGESEPDGVRAAGSDLVGQAQLACGPRRQDASLLAAARGVLAVSHGDPERQVYRGIGDVPEPHDGPTATRRRLAVRQPREVHAAAAGLRAGESIL